MVCGGAFRWQFSQLNERLQECVLRVGFRLYPGGINIGSDFSIRPSEIIRIRGRSNQDSSILLKLMNQLDQLVADINRRNLGIGHSSLFKPIWLRFSSLFKPIWRRFRRFGGRLILGDERTAEQEQGDGVLHGVNELMRFLRTNRRTPRSKGVAHIATTYAPTRRTSDLKTSCLRIRIDHSSAQLALLLPSFRGYVAHPPCR